MQRSKFIALISLVLSANIFVFGQTTTSNESPTAAKDDKEKARLELESKALALADRIAADAEMLKIAKNRAYLLAASGDLLWKQDKKRAQTLFRNAASNLALANAEAEKTENDDPAARFYFYNSPRPMILQIVARRDPDLALELLVQTRSSKIAAEMQRLAPSGSVAALKESEGTSFVIAGSLVDRNNLRAQAQEELRIEQSLSVQAAEHDPRRAAKLIRESMTRGISFEILNVVRKLQDKDAELAGSLLTEITQKIIDSDLSQPTSSERQMAAQLLRQFGSSQSASTNAADVKKQFFKIDDKQLRDLANKFIDNLLGPTSGANSIRLGFEPYYELNWLMPVLEKLAPERVAALRQKLAEMKKVAPEEVKALNNLNSLNDPNATPDKLISDAAKMPVETGMRAILYRRATELSAEKNNLDQIKQLLVAAAPGRDRDDALAYLNGKLAEKAVREGKYNEARKFIAAANSKRIQIAQLVKLALAFKGKNDQESRESARKIMDEARAMLDPTLQGAEDWQNVLLVAAGYAEIAPEQSFTLLEPLVDQANELIQAAALLAKFQKGQSLLRDGELLIFMGIGQALEQVHFLKELGALAAADFERTRDLADKFQRHEIRILARTLVAQSVLNEKPDPLRMSDSSDNMFFYGF